MLKKSQCWTSSGFCFQRTLLWVTWLDCFPQSMSSRVNKEEEREGTEVDTGEWGTRAAPPGIFRSGQKMLYSEPQPWGKRRRRRRPVQLHEKTSWCHCSEQRLPVVKQLLYFSISNYGEYNPSTAPQNSVWSWYPNFTLHSIKAYEFKKKKKKGYQNT